MLFCEILTLFGISCTVPGTPFWASKGRGFTALTLTFLGGFPYPCLISAQRLPVWALQATRPYFKGALISGVGCNIENLFNLPVGRCLMCQITALWVRWCGRLFHCPYTHAPADILGMKGIIWWRSTSPRLRRLAVSCGPRTCPSYGSAKAKYFKPRTSCSPAATVTAVGSWSTSTPEPETFHRRSLPSKGKNQTFS